MAAPHPTLTQEAVEDIDCLFEFGDVHDPIDAASLLSAYFSRPVRNILNIQEADTL